jgi:hypothetical protein
MNLCLCAEGKVYKLRPVNVMSIWPTTPFVDVDVGVDNTGKEEAHTGFWWGNLRKEEHSIDPT